MTTSYEHGQKFFIREHGRRLATPLLAVLIMIETTDVVFAVDSVPAILAVSREPFIVFSSNAFAILGLRALYFCLAGMAGRFRYLNIGLGFILGFVGVKMLITEWYHFPTATSLVVIATALTVSVILSLRADKRDLRNGTAEDQPASSAPDAHS
jgi:tellurite resistance protein TerC